MDAGGLGVGGMAFGIRLPTAQCYPGGLTHLPDSRTPHRQLLLEHLTDKRSSTGVRCNHTRRFQRDSGYLGAKCLTMQTIVSCTGRGRFSGPFVFRELGNSVILLPLRFRPGQCGLGRNERGRVVAECSQLAGCRLD